MFVNGYEFLSFSKTIGKNIGKNISKSFNGQYSQKLVDHSKQSATDALKTVLKGAILKTAEVVGDLSGNKIASKITKV